MFTSERFWGQRLAFCGSSRRRWQSDSGEFTEDRSGNT